MRREVLCRPSRNETRNEANDTIIAAGVSTTRLVGGALEVHYYAPCTPRLLLGTKVTSWIIKDFSSVT